MLSVNTNYGAMIALQNLNKTNQDLSMTQNAINTGLRVSGPKDNGAIHAVAQGMRKDVLALNAVTNSLNRAVSAVDTAVAAGQALSDLITEMKEKAIAASDTSIDQNSREAYNADFVAMRDQIQKIVDNATFDGLNLIDGSTTKVEALANADGNAFVTVAAQVFSLGSTIVTIRATNTISTQDKASAMIATIETTLNALNLALAKLGTGSKKLNIHKSFVGKLQDELTKGVGNLVDADLAKESAKLQSLQTKQQLGVQALSIANQAPQVILSLFR
ncbi:MAG TPA: flagellin [Alphaproteobacteria bacterium]|nr:flagellin [Alphaproteobacteria bacterium]HAJ47199.1 flagellin [Alphaproteobacteria bacterium]